LVVVALTLGAIAQSAAFHLAIICAINEMMKGKRSVLFCNKQITPSFFYRTYIGKLFFDLTQNSQNCNYCSGDSFGYM